MDKTLEKAWNYFGMFALVVLLSVAVIGIKGCTSHVRDKEAACMSAGGDVIYDRCVTGEQVPVENWRK